MDKIKPIENTKHLCWKCLQEHDNIHKFVLEIQDMAVRLIVLEVKFNFVINALKKVIQKYGILKKLITKRSMAVIIDTKMKYGNT